MTCRNNKRLSNDIELKDRFIEFKSKMTFVLNEPEVSTITQKILNRSQKSSAGVVVAF